MNEKKLITIEKSLAQLLEQMHQRRLEADEQMLYPHSFINMQDFLTLKKHDLRLLQQQLKEAGLSSLHHSHAHLSHTIEQERILLQRVALQQNALPEQPNLLSPSYARRVLNERAKFLRGEEEKTSIMLTLAANCVEDDAFEVMLAQSPISIVRINTAHDDLPTWRKMAAMVERINTNTRAENPIRIYVDLAGPKIRTGTIRKIVLPFKICTSSIQRVFLVSASTGETKVFRDPNNQGSLQATIAVEEDFYTKLQHADYVEINDHDRKPRYFKIISHSENGYLLECKKKVTIAPKTDITIQLDKQKFITAHPENFETVPEEIRLYTGDRVWLTDTDTLGHNLSEGPYRAVIPCAMAEEIFPLVRKGDRIFIDDGKIEIEIIRRDNERVLGKVTGVKPGGTLVKEQKGVNFPDTPLKIAAITAEDRANLEHVKIFADIIGLSFAQSAEDVRMLKTLLQAEPDKGIVIKVETKEGVHKLPEMLYELFSWKHGAVMLARGDLAIEVGFENLPRAQEEILNLCESAHTPVVYATQILENLMKKSIPSRAEVIDASIARRTECVMLNKGPFTYRAVEVLERILDSMEELFYKGEPLLTRIREWDGFRDRLQLLRKL